MMSNEPGLPRRPFLLALILALFGRALSLPSLLGGRRARAAGRSISTPTIGVDLAKPGADHSAYSWVMVKDGRVIALPPAILILSDGTLLPGWIAEDEAWWHGAGRAGG